MSTSRDLIDTNPSPTGFDPAALAECIDACFACVAACTACADACLGEDTVAELRDCITTDLGCADVCAATARVLSRQTGYDAELTQAVLTACRTACARCAEDCEAHADHHEHCRICAEACRRCERACAALLDG